jgi:hypothetical protein
MITLLIKNMFVAVVLIYKVYDHETFYYNY